jgi:hypothetical protein
MAKKIKFLKRGYRCAKAWRPRYFGLIHIDGDLHFCPDGNFVYNTEKEEDKLYMGQPCIYTDIRFDTEKAMNYFHSTYLYHSRRNFDKLRRHSEWVKPNRTPRDWGKLPLTLKSCIRKVRKIKGIPKGTVIEFGNHWYYPGTGNIPSYVYIHDGKDSDFIPDYQINAECYTARFTSDEWANELTDKLRAAGFLVAVWKSNPGFIFGESEGEIATVYGFNKKIGFSTGNNDFRGYGAGCENVLYDYRNYFDKWSKALTIKKTKPIDEIVRQLKEETVKDAYPFDFEAQEFTEVDPFKDVDFNFLNKKF